MVEEAAGTRMYETKKVAAIKTIDKKQMKVDELNSVLSDEITPTLEKLRGEKQHYLKWSKNNADIERIERFVVASDFMKAQQALDTNAEGFAEMEEKVAEYEEEARLCRNDIAAKEAQIATMSSKLSGEFEELHNKTKITEEKRSKDLVKVTSAWQNSKKDTQNATSDWEAAQALVAETIGAVSAKEIEIGKESETFEQEKKDAANAEEELAQLSQDYQNMCAGISSSQGDEGRTLPDQISKAHSDSNAADAKAKQAKMKITHLTKALKVRRVCEIHFRILDTFEINPRCLV